MNVKGRLRELLIESKIVETNKSEVTNPNEYGSKPINNFLSMIFNENAGKASKSFTYEASWNLFNEKVLHYYKNEVTGKGVVIDEHGTPHKIRYSRDQFPVGKQSNGRYKKDFVVRSYKDIPFEQAFKETYKDIDKKIMNIDEADEAMTHYAEYNDLREDILTRMGIDLKKK